MTKLTIKVEGNTGSGRSTWAEFVNIILRDYAVENDFACKVHPLDEHQFQVEFTAEQLEKLQRVNALAR